MENLTTGVGMTATANVHGHDHATETTMKRGLRKSVDSTPPCRTNLLK